MAQRFDYIVAGAGAAGLSLLHHLEQAGLSERRVLLLDRAPKTHNDRTWCFWEAGEGPFEAVIFRRWGRLAFHAPGFSRTFDIAPYTYKMLRGLDFYRHMDERLARWPRLTRLYGELEAVGDGFVRLEGQTYTADWVFSSVPSSPLAPRPPYHHLLQHFRGWVLEAPHPTFDPGVATFMDFRVEQQGEVRFVYVLPFDERRALVEYTLFSAHLLSELEYEAGLRAYIHEELGLREYRVLETEAGVIPMTDIPFPARLGERTLYIGTAGGQTKASTGYTFQRIQRQCRHIVQSLAQGREPAPPPSPARFAFYDSVLLNVFAKKRYPGAHAFRDLFRRRPAPQVLKFLDESTTLLEELPILFSMNVPVFTLAALDVLALAVSRKR
ncbi:lycopene cyclase family protein [Calidithermus timidus]|jgi:lycopene beta-cyclase|uniref:lycopene cyclase family protein n=1 Tax=Calidithermus timidus TaxID=307124 RepID=UPI00035F24AF|nr:lycopene cyclase family protein [Calidithermus timidus]